MFIGWSKKILTAEIAEDAREREAAKTFPWITGFSAPSAISAVQAFEGTLHKALAA
jgi:hypothetical protein